MLAVEVQNMQNNPEKKPNPFKTFLRDKGYYIVLVLCVAAVGVSGYLFVQAVVGRDKADVVEAPSLSVPLTPSTSTAKPVETPQASRLPGSAQSDAAPETESGSGAAEDAAQTLAPAEDVPAAAQDAGEDTVRPLSGETVNPYSAQALTFNETTRDWRVHEGVDIAAAAGTEVVAARDGMVSAVYEDDALGTTVAVDHEGGYTSYYANLSAEPPVAVGQAVKAGEAVGAVGESAVEEVALGSHLHFAVTCSGQVMDPDEFLAS